jgi:allantoin racemase
MRKALIINPNTSLSMTASIRETAERVFAGTWEATVERAPGGPASLESWRDYRLATIAILPLLPKHADAEGIVLACFGDPGLFMLKEIASVPVVGVAEAAMSMALLLGGRFGILAGMKRAVELMDSMVRTYGLEARYAGTRPLGMRVLDFEAHREKTLAVLTETGESLRADGADVLLLGCAGLTSFTAELEAALGMTIVDPVEAGCRMLKAIVESGLSVSHAGIYTRPAPQEMRHLERLFEADMTELLSEWEEGI